MKSLKLFLVTLGIALGLSMAVGVSPASADADFTSDASIDCTPSYDPIGATYELRWGDVNPDGVTVLTRTFNGSDLGPANANGSVTIGAAEALAGGQYRYTWEYRDAEGNMIANGNGGEYVGADDCTPETPVDPEAHARIECSVEDGVAVYRVYTEVTGANGNSEFTFNPANGSIVDNVSLTVTVSYTNIHWQPGSISVTANATDDCTPEPELTPEFAAQIVCAVDGDSAVFTISTSVLNQNGATNIVFDPADGSVVANENQNVNVSWTSNTDNPHTDTIPVTAVNDCTPDKELTPEFAAQIVCAVDGDSAVFTLSTTVLEQAGATNIVFDPADGSVVANENQNVNVSWTSNTDNPHTDTIPVTAAVDCTPTPDPSFGAHLVCTPLPNEMEEFRMSTEVINAAGATNVVFDPADGQLVQNEDQAVVVSYDLDGPQSMTLNVKAIPGCAIPDGDIVAVATAVNDMPWQTKTGLGSVLAGLGWALWAGFGALRRRFTTV